MIRIDDIINKVSENNPRADADIIKRAYIYSAKAHEGQTRFSGEPYLSHPLEVANILAGMNLDPVSVASGLLHDTIEDTAATPEEIQEFFGADALHIVCGVTKLSALNINSPNSQAESIRKMFLATADDLRVIMIKLADRLHNMRTLHYHPKLEKQKKIAKETYDIFAPVAGRLGINWMKKELEDIAFKYLMPIEYGDISKRINKSKTEREEFIEKVKRLIIEKMTEAGLKCEVLGRYKHFNSIYQKMISRNLGFEDIYDIIAFRIVVRTVQECYEALGLIHSLWKPIDGKIKDYIAMPKSNLYQSLHTTVIEKTSGERIEIQIRTKTMDEVAESGIAAHWSYKQGEPASSNINHVLTWINKLIKNQKYIRDPDEFLENVRIDLFPDEVYVYTPQGDVKTLPRGATPVDFAYLIHTEVGHQCTGAKINNRLVTLKTELQTGDVVKILTAKNHAPSKDWLKFVKTVKAKSRINQWVREQEKERSITLGREMCEKTFRKHKLSFKDFLNTDKLLEAAEHFKFKTSDDLIANVGYGKITPLQVLKKVTPKEVEEENTELREMQDSGNLPSPKHSESAVLVKGVGDILMKFGKCCNPVRGDDITGYITQGYGITVHRKDCINAQNINPERKIEVEWNTQIKDTYPVTIKVVSTDRIGMLADVAAIISSNKMNILTAESKGMEDGTAVFICTLCVENTEQLRKISSQIRRIQGILEVTRLKNR